MIPDARALIPSWLVKLLAAAFIATGIGWAKWSTNEHFDARASIQHVTEAENEHYQRLREDIADLKLQVKDVQPTDAGTLSRIERKIDGITAAQDALARRQQALEKRTK